jgi:hypothetical protein
MIRTEKLITVIIDVMPNTEAAIIVVNPLATIRLVDVLLIASKSQSVQLFIFNHPT